MKSIPAIAVLAVSVVLACVGCTESSSDPTPSIDAMAPAPVKLSQAACTAIEDAARASELPAIMSNLTCKVASDCMQVRFAASCFESCYAIIATSGLPALQAAEDAVEAKQCVDYQHGGCQLIPPPCGSRYHPEVFCVQGACTNVPE